MEFKYNGLVVLDKPSGLSSFLAVKIVKKSLLQKRLDIWARWTPLQAAF